MAKVKQLEDGNFKQIGHNAYMFEAKAPVKPPLATIKKSVKFNILDFGNKNNFPQELIRAINSSPTGRACTKSHAKFIAGDGFVWPTGSPEQDAFYREVQKYIDIELLQRIAYDYTYFEAITLHLMFDMNGDLAKVKHVDTSQFRLGEPDEDGIIRKCKISADWENTTGTYASLNKPVEYDLYDPIHTKETILQLASNPEDFKNWGGCIMYYRRYSPGQPYYITPSWSSSLNYIYTDGKIQDFHANNIDNAFMPSVLIYFPGELKGEVEYKGVTMKKEDALKQKLIDETGGADNAGKPIVLYGQNGVKPEVIQFNANSNHELFIALERLITEAITRAFQIPQVLAGIKTSGQLGTSNEISNAIELYYNTVIKDDVNFIESLINMLVRMWSGYVPSEEVVKIANSKPFNYIDTAFKDAFAIGEIRESAGYAWEKPEENQPNMTNTGGPTQ